jgi:hypothetical protein
MKTGWFSQKSIKMVQTGFFGSSKTTRRLKIFKKYFEKIEKTKTRKIE